MDNAWDEAITRKDIIETYPDLKEMVIGMLRDDMATMVGAIHSIRLNHDVLRRTFSEKDIKDVSDKLYNFHTAIQKYVGFLER